MQYPRAADFAPTITVRGRGVFPWILMDVDAPDPRSPRMRRIRICTTWSPISKLIQQNTLPCRMSQSRLRWVSTRPAGQTSALSSASRPREA